MRSVLKNGSVKKGQKLSLWEGDNDVNHSTSLLEVPRSHRLHSSHASGKSGIEQQRCSHVCLAPAATSFGVGGEHLPMPSTTSKMSVIVCDDTLNFRLKLRNLHPKLLSNLAFPTSLLPQPHLLVFGRVTHSGSPISHRMASSSRNEKE